MGYVLSDAYLGLDQFYTISCNLDILQQPREIGGYRGSKFEKMKKRALNDDDMISLAASSVYSERMAMDDTADPFLNIETTNDLIGLKQQAQAVNGNQLQGGSYAQS